MILVDSSVWVNYFIGVANAETDILDQLLGVEPVAVGDIILTEVLQGFRRNSEYQTARELMTELPVFTLGGMGRVLMAADHHRLLRRKGITVRKTVDTIIATFCIEQRYPLLFTDRDFQPFVTHLNLIAVVGPQN